MPMVGGKKYSYDKKGMAQAERAREGYAASSEAASKGRLTEAYKASKDAKSKGRLNQGRNAAKEAAISQMMGKPYPMKMNERK